MAMDVKKNIKTSAAGSFVQILKPTVLTLAMGCVGSAWAVDGGHVVAGTGSIDTRGNKTVISQSSDKMIVNWNNFDIARNQSVDIRQPGASSAVLNRASGSPTQILGTLKANGRVFVVNPAGVMFGQSAKVDVGSLVASTLDVNDAQFMQNGNAKAGGSSRISPPRNPNVVLSASANGGQGEVRNEGRINASGQVLLLGAQAVNNGTIRAADVGLAAADQVMLTLGGSGYAVRMQAPAVNALVQNGGLIVSKGGDVSLSAMATGDMLRNVVRNTGTIEANKAVAGAGGTIVLSSELDGVTSIAGKLVADESILVSASPSIYAEGGQYGSTPPAVYAPSGHNISIEQGARLQARQGTVSINALGGHVISSGKIQADRANIGADSVFLEAPINVAKDAYVTATQGGITQNADIRAGGNVILDARSHIYQGNGVLTSAGRGEVTLRTQAPRPLGPDEMETTELKGVVRVADIKADSINIDAEHVYLDGNLKADGDVMVSGARAHTWCGSEEQCYTMFSGAITQNGSVVSKNGNVMLDAVNRVWQSASSRTQAGKSVELTAPLGSIQAGNIRADQRIAIDAREVKLIGPLTASEVILPRNTQNVEGNVRIKSKR